MMKMFSGKPVSSPGRIDKYPPPLMRFLRSKSAGGSRSRGRSRSSPIFLRKKAAAAAAIETQEPSSPKVTCMGQVRVRRSKQTGSSTKPERTRGASEPNRRRCKWIPDALCFHPFAGKIKPASLSPTWPKWLSFVSFRRKSDGGDNSPRREPVKPGYGDEPGGSVLGNGWQTEEEDGGGGGGGGGRGSGDVSVSTPPKNALLFTRSRSAPYRSSSLACRFWGSPLTGQGEADEPEKETDDTNTEPEGESVRGYSDKQLRSKPTTDDRNDESSATTANGERDETEALADVRPMILTRCKSEPARTGQKLDPEIGSWKQEDKVKEKKSKRKQA